MSEEISARWAARRRARDLRVAPAAGTVLADFGADVVHIEHPRIGDAYRYLPQLRPLPACDANYCWILTARGKQSIALDLQCDAGRAVARDLVRRAERLHHEPASVRARESSACAGRTWRRRIRASSTRMRPATATPAPRSRSRATTPPPGGRARASWTRCAPVAPSSGSRPRVWATTRAPMTLVRCDRARALRPRAHRLKPPRALVAPRQRCLVERDPDQAALCGAPAYQPPDARGFAERARESLPLQ